MAEVTYGNDGTSTVGIRTRGDGFNAAAQIDAHRVEATGELGLASQWALGGGTLYAGGGVRATVGINYRPTIDLHRTTRMPTYTDRINAPQAYAFLNDLQHDTRGSYNLRDVTIGAAIDLGTRYPALLKPRQQALLQRIDHTIDATITEVEQARSDLANALAKPGLPSALTQNDAFMALKAAVDTPITRAPIDGVTITQLSDALDKAENALKKQGGASGMVGTLDNELTRISTQLHQVVGDKAPDIALSKTEKERLTGTLDTAITQLDNVAADLHRVPDPAQLRHYHDIARKVMSYDPSVEAAVYAAGAYASPTLPIGGRITLSGSVEQGKHVDADNLWAVRRNDGKLHAELIPSTIRNTVTAIGIGSTPSVTMPEEVARRLNLSLPDSGLHGGGYVAVRQQHEILMGVVDKHDRVDLVGKVSQGLGNGNYQYAEIGVSAPLKAPDGAKPSAVIRLGRTF